MNADYADQIYRDLLKRYEGTQKTLEKLDALYRNALKKIALLEAEKVQWQTEKIQQCQIIQQQLKKSDEAKTALQDEIIKLKERLKKAGLKWR